MYSYSRAQDCFLPERILIAGGSHWEQKLFFYLSIFYVDMGNDPGIDPEAGSIISLDPTAMLGYESIIVVDPAAETTCRYTISVDLPATQQIWIGDK